MNIHEFVGFKFNREVRASLENVQYHSFHMHKNVIEIICVLDGSVHISDCASDHYLSYGDVYLFNPKDPHKLSSDTPNVILTVHIQIDYFSKFFPDLSETWLICDSYANSHDSSAEMRNLRFLLAKIYYSYSDGRDEKALEDLTCDLLSLLIDQFHYFYYQKDLKGEYEIRRRMKSYVSHKNYERIYEIIHYDIYKHFDTKLSMADIASREYLSTTNFSQQIKKAVGLSFKQLLSCARCEEAERLLCGTEKTIDEIARETGFANRQHFASNFRIWYKKTPTDYRRSIHADAENAIRIDQSPFDYDYAMVILNCYLDGF